MGVKKQGVEVHILTLHYANSAHSLQVSLSSLTFSLQQVQTCVWDVSIPFKIVLVKGSKVNAEETAKVNSCFVHIHKTSFFLLMCHCKHSPFHI